VQHTRDSKIVNVNVSSSTFGRHVRPWEGLAHDAVSGRIFERGFGIDLEVEAALSDQVCEGNASPTSLRPYLAINRDEVIGLATEALCRELDEHFARRRGSLPNLHAAALDTTRTRGPWARLSGATRAGRITQLVAPCSTRIGKPSAFAVWSDAI
jgi:hypothetical protein